MLGTDPNNTTNVLNTTSFRATGAIKQLNYGNGLQLTMTYNANRQQPLTMKVGPNGAGTIVNYAYDYYDANGYNNNRIRKITDNVDSAYTVQYNYDDYNRLANAQGDVQGGTYSRVYQYDHFGNLRQVGGAGGPHATYTLNYDNNATGAPATNRIASVTEGTTQPFTYDTAGNMTAGDGLTYAYDGASRLSSVNGGALGQYGYDGDGMRVKKSESGQTVYYVRSSKLGQVAFEVAGASVQRAYVYVGSGKLVAEQATDGQFYWLHTNHLNSARAMTDTAGNLVYKAQLDPHGQTLAEWSATGNTNLNLKKFTGYERDMATGLDYAGARTYNSFRGRFMQPDPMGFNRRIAKRPQSLNRYSYASNDPINRIDPSGRYDYPPCNPELFGAPRHDDPCSDEYEEEDEDLIDPGIINEGGGGGAQRKWGTNFIQGLRDRFKNPGCADFIRKMRGEIGIDKTLVDLARSLIVEQAQAYADNGDKIAGRFYPDQNLIRISPLTSGDVSTQSGADYVYSILLIHELFHYTGRTDLPYTPHVGMVIAAERIGLTDEEKKKLEDARKLDGQARDDAYSDLATGIFMNRCPN